MKEFWILRFAREVLGHAYENVEIRKIYDFKLYINGVRILETEILFGF